MSYALVALHIFPEFKKAGSFLILSLPRSLICLTWRSLKIDSLEVMYFATWQYRIVVFIHQWACPSYLSSEDTGYRDLEQYSFTLFLQQNSSKMAE